MLTIDITEQLHHNQYNAIKVDIWETRDLQSKYNQFFVILKANNETYEENTFFITPSA